MRDLEPRLAVHGGDLDRIARAYGLPVGDLLDFSANVNPLGPPDAVLRAIEQSCAQTDALRRYPDPRAHELTEKVHERFGVAPECVVVGNGSAALIDAVLRAVAPDVCLVPTPAFSEYRRATAACPCAFEAFPLFPREGFALVEERMGEALARVRPGVLLLNNPHNPSGCLIPREAALRLVRAAADTGSTVVLDEAFIDYVPEHSLMDVAESLPQVVVIRSLTKFYAMPALRVGYAVASRALAQRIAAFMPSWPVSSIAIDAAVAALSDRAFEERSLESNREQRETLMHALRNLSLRVFPSAANFLLVELPQALGSAGALRERLIRRFGVVVRGCDDYAGLESGGFLRVAVKDETSNRRLVDAIRGSL